MDTARLSCLCLGLPNVLSVSSRAFEDVLERWIVVPVQSARERRPLPPTQLPLDDLPFELVRVTTARPTYGQSCHFPRNRNGVATMASRKATPIGP
jgi:hypothetical protein